MSRLSRRAIGALFVVLVGATSAGCSLVGADVRPQAPGPATEQRPPTTTAPEEPRATGRSHSGIVVPGAFDVASKTQKRGSYVTSTYLVNTDTPEVSVLTSPPQLARWLNEKNTSVTFTARGQRVDGYRQTDTGAAEFAVTISAVPVIEGEWAVQLLEKART